jgi:hypothetical protein
MRAAVNRISAVKDHYHPKGAARDGRRSEGFAWALLLSWSASSRAARCGRSALDYERLAATIAPLSPRVFTRGIVFPCMIQTDIEGAEIDALKGAARC